MDEQKVDALTRYKVLKAEESKQLDLFHAAQQKAYNALSVVAVERLKGTTWELIVGGCGVVYLKAFPCRWGMPDEGEKADRSLSALLEVAFPHGSITLYGGADDAEVAELRCDDGRWSLWSFYDGWDIAACLEFAAAYGINLKNDPASRDELLKRIKEQADIEETARANRVALEEKLKLCNDKEMK